MNTDGTGFHTCKECHKTETFWNHTTTDHKEGEQLEDRRSVGARRCNSGDGTDQRVQSLMFMMMMMMMIMMNKVSNVHAMFNEACWCNHYRSGRSIIITYYECVFVALGVLHAMRMGHIIMWPLRVYRIFPNYLIKGAILGKNCCWK